MLTPLLLWITSILLMEGGMWYLFRRGVVRICIPADLSVLRKPRVTMVMLRAFALLHTVFIVAIIAASYFLLW